MAKIKLHNPELAANSKFSNLVVESLSVDPTVSGTNNVGRIWFNSADKTFKATFLDENGTDLTIKTIGDSSQLSIIQNNLTQEITDRTNADNTLQGNIDTVSSNLSTEITNRTNADTVLDNRLTNVEGQVNGKLGDLTTLTTDEKGTIVGAINEVDANTNTNTTAINNEVTARTNADNTLQGNIDTLTTNIVTDYLNKTTSTAQIVVADTTFQGNLVISGDLTVSGASTTIETEILKVADNIITLNNGIGETTTPVANAGLEVDRGIEGVTTIIQWNEALDQVEVFEDATMRKVATTTYVNDQVSASTTSFQTELDASQVGAGLNTDGSYSVNTTANFIASATSLNDADKKLDTQIKTNADSITTLDNRLTTVEGQANGKLGDLTTLTTDEKGTIVGAINEVDAHTNQNSVDIATEITNRTTAVSNVQAELDASQVGAGLNTDGSYSADALTNYLTDATTLKEADKKLDTQIKTNADSITTLDNRLTNVEAQANGKLGDLTTLTTDEKGTIVGAINEVDTNINAEVSRATAAEATITTNLNTETTNRTNADNALGSRIDNINTAAGITGDVYSANATSNFISTATSLTDADNKLDGALKSYQTTISSTTSTTGGTNNIGFEGYTETDTTIINPTIEITAGTLKSAIFDIASSVNTRINDLENRFVKGEVSAADKSDTYTIAHNLDTEFVDVAVQVYDEDELVWRFDLVVIEVIDVNTVKISLASGTASQIRYVIHGY